MLSFERAALDRGGRRLFEDLSFVVDEGSALHVTGPNGAGKSSLIRLAAGLLRESGGRVKRPAILALADDQLPLDRELPLGRALSFWGGNVDRGLDRAGMMHLRDVSVRLLSSGQRKRASLARVFASPARLWLLDEPTNALDSDGTALFAEAIDEHRADGGAILAASHVQLPGEWTVLELAR